jgi:hypothetical protein
MSSPEQNRLNAQHSTGPRTEAGKAASSQNARKHGLSAKYIPLSPEERPIFENLESQLREQIKPRGPLQEIAFSELVAAAWKRHIVNILLCEAASSTRELFSDEVSDRVRKLQRHKADQDRAYNRAMRQITDLQTMDRIRLLTLHTMEAKVPGFNPSVYEGLADYMKITKQTHLLFKNRPGNEEYNRRKIEAETNLMEAYLAQISPSFKLHPREGLR